MDAHRPAREPRAPGRLSGILARRGSGVKRPGGLCYVVKSGGHS